MQKSVHKKKRETLILEIIPLLARWVGTYVRSSTIDFMCHRFNASEWAIYIVLHLGLFVGSQMPIESTRKESPK